MADSGPPLGPRSLMPSLGTTSVRQPSSDYCRSNLSP